MMLAVNGRKLAVSLEVTVPYPPFACTGCRGGGGLWITSSVALAPGPHHWRQVDFWRRVSGPPTTGGGTPLRPADAEGPTLTS